MAYKYRTRRSAKRYAKKSRRNFIITLFLVLLLLYFTINWFFPFFVNGVGFIKDFINPSKKTSTALTENVSLAPPVLNIPYEATNTAQIDIKGYGTPHSKVKLFLDDAEKDTVSVSAEGDFIISSITLSLGTNNIYAKSVDEKNQESYPSKTIKIIFDNEYPPLTLNEPEDNETIQGGNKRVKFSGKTEPDAQIFINNSQIIVDSEGNFTSDQSLNDGENIFNIKAVDSASNFREIQRRVMYQP